VRPALKHAAHEYQVLNLVRFGLVAMRYQPVAQLLHVRVNSVLAAAPSFVIGCSISQTASSIVVSPV